MEKSIRASYILIGYEVKRDKYINIVDGIIESISDDPKFRDQSLDAQGETIIYPGCINTHAHSFQSLLRGYTNDCNLEEFLKIVYTELEEYNENDIYRGAKMAFDEMLGNGITTVCDFFYINGKGNRYAEAVVRAAEDAGIRLNLIRCLIDNPEKSKTVCEDLDVYVDRFNELHEKYLNLPLIKITPCAHSVYYNTIDGIRTIMDMAKKYLCRWQIHFSDSKGTRDYCQKHFKKSNAEYMADNGLLDERLVAVHGIWCNDKDISIMAEHGVSLSHNPQSNQFLGERAALIPEMLQHGMKIGLGTDGAASNPSLSIFEEMKAALLMQKSRLLDPASIKAEQGFRMGTEWGGILAGFQTGKLEPGYAADFILCDATHPTLGPNIAHALSYFTYSLSPRAIKQVYVHGNRII